MNHQTAIAVRLGAWLICKLRRQQATHGTRHAATLARKQGVPLELALLALTGRSVAQS